MKQIPPWFLVSPVRQAHGSCFFFPIERTVFQRWKRSFFMHWQTNTSAYFVKKSKPLPLQAQSKPQSPPEKASQIRRLAFPLFFFNAV